MSRTGLASSLTACLMFVTDKLIILHLNPQTLLPCAIIQGVNNELQKDRNVISNSNIKTDLLSFPNKPPHRNQTFPFLFLALNGSTLLLFFENSTDLLPAEDAMGDFNLALVIVAIILCVIVFVFNVYLLVNYQHPDDKNQAYFPKFVVVLGLSVAAISILMLPADVANRQACRHAIYNGACNLTLPMKDMWLAIYILDAVLVFFIIPFAMFYYEGDQDKSVGKRIRSALLWVVVTAIVCALVLGILYGLVGKVDFTVRHLSSSTTSFPSSWSFSSSQECISGSHQCSAYSASDSSEKTWTMRTTFPEYVVALATIVGSVLFTIFGGVGIACLPLGLIFSFVRRPKAVITRSQYIKEATELGKKAKELKKAADALHQEERSGSKGRKWRKNVKAVEKELLQLEEDVKLLEEVYPQGEKAETTWAMTVLGYLAKLVLGILGLIVSVAWIAHIVIYLLISPPLSPFLNEVFIKLDDIWGLLGTVAFAFFCFYLLLAVIAGAMMLGMKLVFITIHPMKWGATLMNSFLFNVGLILLCSISVIQFCSTAFAYYAQATAAQEIFGHTLQSLRGIRYLYKYNVFQIAFIVLAGLTFVYYAAFVRLQTIYSCSGWRRKKPSGRFQLSSIVFSDVHGLYKGNARAWKSES
ncbi:LMBR1-like membrane protein [Prunus dulcis]|uniref:LMBR1-like membrane protein n=1 Tax=Prunus dulcis TaxID=3755 RepID=A0A4Y1RPW3_PRUDU|nr:LMBR1-like membrane protein [Prunus dulcis]